MNRIADSVIPIKTSFTGFFEAWLDSTYLLLHKLTAKERSIMAVFLRKHYELSQKINDEAILSRVLLDETTKLQVIEECNISKGQLQVAIAQFKKKGLMVGGKIAPKLIPDREAVERGELRLLIVYKYDKEPDNTEGIS